MKINPRKNPVSKAQPKMRLVKAVGIWIAASLFAAPLHAGNPIRIYEDKDGNRLITSRIMPKSEYKLVNTVKKSDVAIDTALNYWRKLKPRSSRYDSYVRQVSLRYNVEASLIKAVIHTESSFNPNAKSHKGAGGLMQLMPGTAKQYGVKNRFNPKDNINGGVKYLAHLLKVYDGDVRLTLAAYNAGPGAVRKYGDIPPYRETKQYVAKVMYLSSLYANQADL